MRLLILTQKVDENDDNLGFFHRWIEEFAQRCELVIVICLYEGAHHLPANVRVLSLGKESGASRFKYLKRFYSYIWSERGNYDAVFVHMNQIYVILGGLLWRMMGKRVSMWYAHGRVAFSLRIATLFSQMIFTSTAESFRIDTAKRYVVGHGIDTIFVPPSAPIERETPTLVSVGRISPSKDHRTIINAFGLILHDGVNARLTFVGSPGTVEQRAYLDELVSLVEVRELSRECVFVGAVAHAQLPHHLQNADIFVHASRTGSLDKAPLEAMATGLPVVTCNESVSTIIPEELRDKLCFRVGDAHDLAQKVKALLSLSCDERRIIGTQLRAVVIRFHTLSGLITRIVDMLNRS